MTSEGAVRVDRWLWAVRVYKTRGDATDACRAGHVEVGGRSVKPAHLVTPGTRVTARAHGRERILEVVAPIDKRVGPAVAATCFVDHSPPEEVVDRALRPLFAERDRGAGRPTKKERRQLDRLRER